jgi:hypothetical protein
LASGGNPEVGNDGAAGHPGLSLCVQSRLAGERRAVLLHNRQPTVRVLAVLFGDL